MGKETNMDFIIDKYGLKAAIRAKIRLQLNVKDECALLRVVCAFLARIWNTCIVRWKRKKKVGRELDCE